ncbi:hypothetical protein GWI33_007360 [Rhynchophorus ferrugineus]|uniref:Uncharacterized protein n=1 Tax=Rhynchophorus ferrugineus TaxID=354439 RepID=A0A834MEW9_RHYFE|nr:hypothetical protein GWI33_007360 [Rhynchophorus ferrugineus]
MFRTGVALQFSPLEIFNIAIRQKIAKFHCCIMELTNRNIDWICCKNPIKSRLSLCTVRTLVTSNYIFNSIIHKITI